MTAFWLRVLTVSDLAVAEHHRGTAAHDVDLIVDNDGLPFVPRWSLHKMLSEAWRERLSRPFASLGPTAASVLGERMAVQPNVIAVMDAELHPDVRAWLRWARRRANEPMSAAEVLAALTVVRQSTGRDRSRGGAPAPMTLRDIRLLRRGTELCAPLDVPDAQGHAAAKFVFAAACLETRSIGLRRNRGLGAVRLSVHEDDHGRPGNDVTAQWYAHGATLGAGGPP